LGDAGVDYELAPHGVRAHPKTVGGRSAGGVDGTVEHEHGEVLGVAGKTGDLVEASLVMPVAAGAGGGGQGGKRSVGGHEMDDVERGST
jgi:hypothetical protein